MNAVSEYSLELEPDDFKWFADHAATERCFPAALSAHGRRFPCWVGYRGRFSRDFAKPSYDLWFPPEGGPDGRRTLHLNAAYRDPSLLRGRLAFRLFEGMGVPVPDCRHVSLNLNGRGLGLYTAMEALDGDWLKRQEAGGGTIYYGVGGEGNFGLLSRKSKQPKRYLAAGYEKCHPPDDESGDLKELIYRITLPEDDEFEATIGDVVDMAECLRWLAGVIFISHTDGLVHNYALIRRPGQRWELSPWDLDGTFGRCPWGHTLPPDEVPLAMSGGNYLAIRLLRSPRWRKAYAALWAELLEGPLSEATVSEHLGAIYREIREPALRDAGKWRKNSTFLREPAYIRRWVADRTRFLRTELKNWGAAPR
ncbi:MAG TPA: CotH kinase family protein [Symbiobacteriaceae bacterium]|jgi:spore coat protein H